MIPRDLVGVVHLRSMPGDPLNSGESFDDVFDAAMRDVDALLQGGIPQLIVENFGSTPFRRGTAADPLEPHVHAFMTRVALAAKSAGAVVGINCLRNDGVGAIGVAAASGADFVRINVLSGAYVTDQGIIEGDAARVLRYRRALGADIGIVADVLVKHASPLGDLTLENAIADTVKRGGAGAVVVSGSGTGQPTSPERVRRAAELASVPVLIGSGATLETLPELAEHADGIIIGTATKRNGDVAEPIDVERVRRLVAAWEDA